MRWMPLLLTVLGFYCFFGAVLMLRMRLEVLGNWLGLSWATPSFAGASKWRESLLLNIRGLSEIVFLNLLLQQQLISPARTCLMWQPCSAAFRRSKNTTSPACGH